MSGLRRMCRYMIPELLLAALLFAGGCGKADNRPSVLLIIIDTLRADHVGCYGHTAGITPNMDRLAAEGVRFSNCVTPVPITFPSFAAIFTSSYPVYNGVRDNGANPIDYSLTTMSEVFRESGYATAAIAGSFVVADGSGIEQGFDHYDSNFEDEPEPGTYLDQSITGELNAKRNADEVTKLAIEWVRKSERPFFFVVHYWDPHYPYEPPDEFGKRWPGNPYLGEVAYTDSQLDRLLEAARKAAGKKRLITILVADHGEALGEHKEPFHGVFVYDCTLLVPFIIHSPELVQDGLVIEEQVSTIDLAPTVLDLVGVEVPRGWQGRSYAKEIRHPGGPSSEEASDREYHSTSRTLEITGAGARPCYIETYRPRYAYQWSELAGVRYDNWKLISAPRPELYDLSSDPYELENLYGEKPDKVQELLSIMEGMLEEYSGPLGKIERETELDEEELEKLKSLGYVMSSKPAATGPLPDPKDKIEEEILAQQILAKIRGAWVLERDGNEEAAEELLEAALELDPENTEVLKEFGLMLWRSGDRARGLTLLENAARLAPASSSNQFNLGIAYMHLGRYMDAAKQFEALVSLDPSNADSRYRYGKCLQLAGDRTGALEQYYACLELNPSMTLAIYDLSVLQLEDGRSSEAKEQLERLLEIEPEGELAQRARELLDRVESNPPGR